MQVKPYFEIISFEHNRNFLEVWITQPLFCFQISHMTLREAQHVLEKLKSELFWRNIDKEQSRCLRSWPWKVVADLANYSLVYVVAWNHLNRILPSIKLRLVSTRREKNVVASYSNAIGTYSLKRTTASSAFFMMADEKRRSWMRWTHEFKYIGGFI